MARTIEIEENISVGTLAEKLSIPVTRLIGQLMKNGIIATFNERVDFDTATIMVEDMGLEDVTLVKALEKNSIEESITKKKVANLTGPNRPPVVAVMGHVVH